MSKGNRAPFIGINGLFLDHARTGTGVYTREVISRLLKSNASTARPRYRVLGHPEHAPEFQLGQYVALSAPLRQRSARVEKVLWEQLTLPWRSARLHVDLLYSPYFSLPLVQRGRRVVTVHDLIPLLLPEYALSPALKSYFRLVSAATRRADAVVTDSQHSAADIVRVLGVEQSRVHVVPLGVDPRYLAPVDPGTVAVLRERLGLPAPCMLYLGGTDPRKNISALLRALRLLKDRGCAIWPLALVAPQRATTAWSAYDPRAEAARLGVETMVRFLDWIDEEDKPTLYAASSAFLFPSRYEGFGLPPLEAMARGVPVLCSRASSLPEVTGQAAVLIDPDDVEGWAEAMDRVCHDTEWRTMLAEAGPPQAAPFTWERTVQQLEAIFTRVLLS